MSRPSQELSLEILRAIEASYTRRVPPIEERFWKKVDRRGDDECWPWLGAVTRGRGGIGLGGRMTSSHRVAVALDGRTIPAGMHVDHICRNGLCHNPKHLRIVTPSINAVENSVGPCARNAAKTHCPKCGNPLAHPHAALILRPKVRTKNGLPTDCITRSRHCLTCKPGYRNSYLRVNWEMDLLVEAA